MAAARIRTFPPHCPLPLIKGGAYTVSAFTCFILHLGSQPTGIPTLSYSLKVPYPCFPFYLIRAVLLPHCTITTAPLSGVRTFYFINNIIRPYHPRFDTRSGTARAGAVNRPSPTFNSPAPIVRTSSPYCRTGKRSCQPIRRYASRAVCPRRGRHSVRCGSAPEHRTPAHIGASQRI